MRHLNQTCLFSDLSVVILLLSILSALFWATFWWSYTADDAYITFHYAKNVALGHGAVFNIGERIEGFSCPLWMFTLALTTWVGLGSVIPAKILGFISLVTLLVLLYYCVRRSNHTPLIASFTSLWFAVLPSVHTYSVSGMETIPFALAIAVATFLPTMTSSVNRAAVILPPSLITVATLRPEGIMVVGVLTLYWLLIAKSRKIYWGLAATWLVLPLLFLLRFVYYGSFLPNTYLAKPSPFVSLFQAEDLIGILRAIMIGFIDKVVPLFNDLGGIILIFFVILSVLNFRKHPAVGAAAAVSLAGVLFLLYVPFDWMPGHRFALPFVPPVLYLVAFGFDWLWRQATQTASAVLKASAVTTVMLVLLLSLVSTWMNWRTYATGQMNTAMDATLYIVIGDWLKKNSGPDERLLGYEIGAIGYTSNLYVIDHEGLISRKIAETIAEAGSYSHVRTGANRSAMERIVLHCVNQQPDWFLVRSRIDISLNLGERVPGRVATQPIQDALIDRLGSSMILKRIFYMNQDNSPASDKYLLLHREKPS